MGLVGLGNMGQGMAANLLQSAANPMDIRGTCAECWAMWMPPACSTQGHVVSFSLLYSMAQAKGKSHRADSA